MIRTFKINKSWVISLKKLAEQFVLLFDPAKNKKVNKHFKIRQQFQNLMTCPNDMIPTLVSKTYKLPCRKYGILYPLQNCQLWIEGEYPVHLIWFCFRQVDLMEEFLRYHNQVDLMEEFLRYHNMGQSLYPLQNQDHCKLSGHQNWNQHFVTRAGLL